MLPLLSAVFILAQLGPPLPLPPAGTTPQAVYLEALAVSSARRGDVLGARYFDALARAAASATAPTVVVPNATNLSPGLTPARPMPFAIAPLPSELLTARNAIERVAGQTGLPLVAAKARYRAALDRFVAGDAAGAKILARQAYRLATAPLGSAR
jgi:hypothetical protein